MDSVLEARRIRLLVVILTVESEIIQVEFRKIPPSMALPLYCVVQASVQTLAKESKRLKVFWGNLGTVPSWKIM